MSLDPWLGNYWLGLIILLTVCLLKDEVYSLSLAASNKGLILIRCSFFNKACILADIIIFILIMNYDRALANPENMPGTPPALNFKYTFNHSFGMLLNA